MKNCNSCGSQMQEDAVFCAECGFKFEDVVSDVNLGETTENPYEASSLVETAEETPVETVTAESVATPNYSYMPEDKADGNGNKDGICITSLVLGIVGFILNPLYICSILAIIFGAIGMKSSSEKKNLATIGLILGCITLFGQLVIDIIFLFLGMPFSFCC